MADLVVNLGGEVLLLTLYVGVHVVDDEADGNQGYEDEDIYRTFSVALFAARFILGFDFLNLRLLLTTLSKESIDDLRFGLGLQKLLGRLLAEAFVHGVLAGSQDSGSLHLKIVIQKLLSLLFSCVVDHIVLIIKYLQIIIIIFT